MAVFEEVTNWIVTVGTLGMLGVVYASWLTSYRTPKATLMGSSLWFRLPPWAQIVAGLAISVVGGYLCYVLWAALPLYFSRELSLVARIAGFVLWGAGMVEVLWGRWTLGAMMGVSTSSATQLRANHQLIQRDAYALVRHPMYLGYWLVVGGLFILYRTWTPLLILVTTIPAFIRRAKREEEALESRFGSDWRAYAARVPMFVPRLR